MKYDWILALKRGDEVIVETHDRLHRATVDKVLKQHLVVGGTKYRFDGSRVGRDVWDTTMLRPATPERLQAVRRQNLLRRAERFRAWGNLSDEQLERVLAVIAETKQ